MLQAEHVVVVSVPVVEVPDQSLFGRQIAPIEAHVLAAKIPFTLLRLPLFIDNNWGNQASIKGQGAIYGPVDPTAQYTSIAVSDAGEAAAVILTHPTHHVHKTYTLTTALYTHADLAAAFAAATGKAVAYVQVPYPAAREAILKSLPEWQTDGVLELFKLIDTHNHAATLQTSDFKAIVGRDPLTITQWTAAVAAAFK